MVDKKHQKTAPIRKERTAAKVKGGNPTKKGAIFSKWMPARRLRNVRSA